MSDAKSNISYLDITVKPRSHRDEIGEWSGGSLKVSVTAPPESGRGNDAVCSLIARALGVGKSSVSIARGTSSRKKVLRLEGVPPEWVLKLGRKS